MTRRERTQNKIDEALRLGDVAALLRIANPWPCACVGRHDGEKHCKCMMNSLQVRSQVSYFGLLNKRIVRFK